MSPYVATLILLWGLFDLSSVEPVAASHRHFHHHHRSRDYDLEESVPRQLSLHRLPAEPTRRWRSLDQWTQDNETGHSRGRPKRHFNNIADLKSHMFQREARQMKDDTLCDYTVTPMKPIQDKNGNFIVKDLNEIKCQSPGSPCHTGQSHCCIQTYMSIIIEEFDFDEGKMQYTPQIIHTGCVCAHRTINNATPQLNRH